MTNLDFLGPAVIAGSAVRLWLCRLRPVPANAVNDGDVDARPTDRSAGRTA